MERGFIFGEEIQAQVLTVLLVPLPNLFEKSFFQTPFKNRIYPCAWEEVGAVSQGAS